MKRVIKPYVLRLLITLMLITDISSAATIIRIDMDADTPGLQTELQVTPGQSFRTNVEVVMDQSSDSLITFGYSLWWDRSELLTPSADNISTFTLGAGWTDFGFDSISEPYISNIANINFGSSQGPLTSVIATIEWTASDPLTDSSVDIIPAFNTSLDTVYDRDNNSFTPVFEGGMVNIIKTPDLMIKDILNYFDESVAAGTLTGQDKKQKKSKKQIKSMRKLLAAAGKFIQQNEIKKACSKLNKADKSSDAEIRPKDLIAGDAVPNLNPMIKELMENMGCGS
jgi:hypothetical protein